MRIHKLPHSLAIAAILVSSVFVVTSQAPAQAATGQLNIMSWNVQGKNLAWNEVYGSTDTVVGKIQAAGAEYVGLQEVSSNQANVIAQRLGWGTDATHVRSEFEHGLPGQFKEGIAIISKYPMSDYTVTPLNPSDLLVYPAGRGRKLQHAKIVKDGRAFHVFNTHLASDDWSKLGSESYVPGSDDGANRNKQARFVLDQVTRLKNQVNDPSAIFVLNGDMNSRSISDTSAGWAYKTLAGGMTDTWLYIHPNANLIYPGKTSCDRPECGNTVSIRDGNPGKSLNPTIRIDYAFVTQGAESFIRTVATPAPTTANEDIYKKYSDHFPYQAIIGPAPATPTPTPAPNKAPVAKFSLTRLTGANNFVALDGSGSYDPDGSIQKWQWSVDGQTLPLYTAKGNVTLGGGTSKTVKLTVTDNSNQSTAVSQFFSLPNRQPSMGAYTPNGVVVPSTTPTLTATAADPDTDPLSYQYHVTGPSVDFTSDWTGGSWTIPAHRLDPGTRYNWRVTVKDPTGATDYRDGSFTVAMLPTSADVTATASGNGYWVVNTYGDVYTYGDAGYFGTLHSVNVNVTNVVGLVRTPDSGGYWIVAADGGVFSFGNAQFYGSMGGHPLNAPVVSMAATKTGHGYWLVAADGGVFAFGDAGFYGSMGGQPLNGAVVAIAPTASGAGYWLAAKDGGIFAFGDAGFYGSMGGQHLNYPVVDMDATPDGGGYWMTAEDGGVFAFGNAGFYGSMAGQPLNGHIVGMSVTPTAHGYWLNGCDGGIFAFGDAVFRGSNPTYMCRGI